MRLQMYGNKATTVADAETHACCCCSVSGASLRCSGAPNVLSLYLRSLSLIRMYLRPRRRRARSPSRV